MVKKQQATIPHAQIREAIDYMASLFPNPQTELRYTTPWQLLLAVMLSAQTTDVNVNRATASLFDTIRTPNDLVNMGSAVFRDSIKTLSFYNNKARHVYETAQRLCALAHQPDVIADHIAHIHPKYRARVTQIRHTHGYYIPASLSSLVTYPGVGEKTAKVVLHTLYGMAYLGVDTHVHRVVNRLGRVTTNTPLQTSSILEDIVPHDLLSIAHHTIILFGRYHCTAKKPHCDTCKITHICPHYKHHVETKHTSNS